MAENLTDDELIALGLVLKRFIEDEENFAWLDRRHNKDGIVRLVLDGNVWGVTKDEAELVKKLSEKAGNAKAND